MSGPTELLSASWGKIRLFCSSVNTDGGRTQVVHEPASGDVHVNQDRGLRVSRTRVQLQFDDFPGNPPPIEAARELEAAKDSGLVAMFSHPVFGRYLASIGEFHWSIDASSVISAEAEFIKEAPAEAITPAGPGSGAAGIGSVSAAAQILDGALADVGLLKMTGPSAASFIALVPGGRPIAPGDVLGVVNMNVATAQAMADAISNKVAENANAVSRTAGNVLGLEAGIETAFDVAAASILLPGLSAAGSAATAARALTGAGEDPRARLATTATGEAAQGMFSATTIDARVAVTSWSEGAPPRQVTVDVARISANLATVIDQGGLTSDLALWSALVAAVTLGDAVRSAAIAATSEVPSVFIMRVQDRTALLPLAARVYGGAQAQDRARQIALLNDIPTIGWLPPGDYIAPARSAAQRLR